MRNYKNTSRGRFNYCNVFIHLLRYNKHSTNRVMMKKNHKSSPWLVKENKYSQHIYIYTDEAAFEKDALHVCKIDKEFNVNWQADLPVISAAPDLLAALKKYICAFEAHLITNQHPEDGDSTGKIAELARLAIAKATAQENGS